jgi:molecular chaperone HscA
MNLLQISEPEKNRPSISNEYAVGIDLGTTNSVVSCVIDGKAKALGPILPSVYQGIRSIKRLMGSDGKAVETSAQILLSLKKQAEQELGLEISKAVITVPAHFDDAARNDTKLAAKLAGLEVMRLINEPTAAAVSYGLDNTLEGYYLIYDLGGGTFDVSLLRMEKGVFQVLSHGGDRHLGGDDIDHLLLDYFKLGEDNYYKVREAKEKLSYQEEVSLNSISLSKEKFEELITPMIEKTIKIVEQTIKEGKIDRQNINEIVLVGGSTRIPLIKKLIAEQIKLPLDNLDPDRVVAFGAAIQADGLLHGSNNLLLDVTSLSIGLEVMGGLNERIIHKNSTIPLSVTKYFTTYQDGQTGMKFHIVQGEREMAQDCRSLAKFELKGIPPMKASVAKVAVTFKVDADGLLMVSAIEQNSGVHQEIEVKPSYGLSKEKIEEMIEQSYLYAKEDVFKKKLIEEKLNAQNNIRNIAEAIAEEGDLLSLDEKNKISLAITNLQNQIILDDYEAINSSNRELDDQASHFMQERLNLKLKQALAGKNTKTDF